MKSGERENIAIWSGPLAIPLPELGWLRQRTNRKGSFFI